MALLYDEFIKSRDVVPGIMPYVLIAFTYNQKKFIFAKSVTPEEVHDIIHFNATPRGVDVEEIITIAKLVCQVIAIADKDVCPIVNSLP